MNKKTLNKCYVVLCAGLCAILAFSNSINIYAGNDDEYITFNNIDIIRAYNFFSLYGFNADSSYSYTDTYTSTGSFTQSATISLSGSGGFSGAGEDESLYLGGILTHGIPGDDAVYTLNIDGGITGQLNPTSTTPSHLTLACTFNTPTAVGGAADYEYQKMTCTDSAFVDVSRYNVTLNVGTDAVEITGQPASTLAHFVSAEDAVGNDYASVLRTEGSYNFSGSLTLNNSGSLTGSGSLSISTTTTNVNNLKYVVPLMKKPSIISNPDPTNSPNTKLRFLLDNNDPFVICFLSNSYINDPFDFSVSPVSNSYTASIGSYYFKRTGKFTQSMFIGGYNFIAIESYISDSGYYIIQFSNSYFSGEIIPVYVGFKSQISNDTYRFIYGSDRIIDAINNQTTIIESGNTNSQNKGTQLDNQTTSMQSQMTQFQNIEDTAGNNMNTALNNIPTPNLTSNNKFLVSADWIRQQFNRIVTNTPFEAVITFCLVFGLGLLLLGKVR